MASIAFGTIKGGVGKTTLSVSVATELADRGHRVLFIDLDPQAHASMMLGLDPGDRPCVGDTFGPRPRHTLEHVVVQCPKHPSLWLAPACLRMSGLERDLFHWGFRLEAIPRALESLGWAPDVIVADTPPNLGALTESALHFFELVVAPVPTGAFALQGLDELELAWRDVRNPKSALVALVNMWDRRTNATNAAMDEALKGLKVPVLKTRIPRAEALNQAGLAFEVIYDNKPSASVVDDLRTLTSELSKRLKLKAPKRAAHERASAEGLDA